MRTLRPSSLAFAVFAFLAPLSTFAATYYVAANGNDSGAGSQGAPWATIAHAQSVAVGGDIIYIRGGMYAMSSGSTGCGGSQTANSNAVALSKSGSAGKLMQYWAYPGDSAPVFDFTNLMDDCRVRGFGVTGSYIHLKGIEITGVKQRNNLNHESWGVWNSGSNNIFEMLNIHHIDGTGLFIQSGGNNLVLNCDSHHNFDPLTSNGACESGDGFGAHISASGTGNVFRGCRSWFNSDDDYDLINAFAPVTIENCWAWHAGYRYDTGAACGNGNGIKAGGYGTDTSTFPANPPVHVIRQNLSIGNRAAGFYANHHPGTITFYNNTSYNNNPDFNMLGMDTSGANITVGTYRNNLAVAGTLTSNATNPDAANNSWTLSVTANASDFQSVSETGLDGPRQADGSQPVLSNFRLVTGSDLIDKGVNVGLPYNGASPDLGCFETGGSTGGAPATGGAPNSGGASASGGTSTTGGVASVGGSKATGGTMAGNGGSIVTAGGSNSTGGLAGTGGTTASTGGHVNNGTTGGSSTIMGTISTGGSVTTGGNAASSGGLAGSVGGAPETPAGGALAVGGQVSVAGSSGVSGSSTASGGGDSGEVGNCGCRVTGNPRTPIRRAGVFALLGLAATGLLRRRQAVG